MQRTQEFKKCYSQLRIVLYLNIEQPWLDSIYTLLFVCHLPHGDVQRTMREETLVRSIVLLLRREMVSVNNICHSTVSVRILATNDV